MGRVSIVLGSLSPTINSENNCYFFMFVAKFYMYSLPVQTLVMKKETN
jgi:hypothetical protein